MSKEEDKLRLADILMREPSFYAPLGEAFKGWSCEVTKEGIKVFKPKKDE